MCDGIEGGGGGGGKRVVYSLIGHSVVLLLPFIRSMDIHVSMRKLFNTCFVLSMNCFFYLFSVT